MSDILSAITQSAQDRVVQQRRAVIAQGDARVVLRKFPADSVACTITSPPYGDLKDYGSPGQIGFGQHYDTEYLPALKEVLCELHRVSKPGAALWVVLDTIKSNGVLTPLPWQVADLANQVGWTFHDLVIWDKGRTLPWSHRGRFRNVFEYILLLGKGPLAVFDLDAVRDTDSLGPYWVRYPERYNPYGKAPTDLWHFPIPVQGSWSKGAVRHLCPFPIGLVARMLALTTRAGDVVLDCFAGTGSVPATAAAMQRKGIGIELNPAFVDAFQREVCDELTTRARKEFPPMKGNADLAGTIVKLRMQKYSKTLFNELSRSDRLNGLAREGIRAFVLRNTVTLEDDWIPRRQYALARIHLDVLAQRGANLSELRGQIEACTSVRPLSKFGVEAAVQVRAHNAWSVAAYVDELPRGPWFLYRAGRFYSRDLRIERAALHQTLISQASDSRRKLPPLFSQLDLDIQLPADG